MRLSQPIAGPHDVPPLVSSLAGCHATHTSVGSDPDETRAPPTLRWGLVMAAAAGGGQAPPSAGRPTCLPCRSPAGHPPLPPCSFHNFNVLFRDNDDVECVGFTAAQVGAGSLPALVPLQILPESDRPPSFRPSHQCLQIPNIEGRLYPPELSGELIAAPLRWCPCPGLVLAGTRHLTPPAARRRQAVP